MKRNLIIEIISALLILLFVYTASSKLLNLETTYGQMNNQPFANWMTPYLVWGISLAELLVSGLLMFKRTKNAGFWASLILMTAFTGYIAAILLRFFDRVPCSCGGVIKQLGWTNHLYFNLFFLGISAVGLLLLKKQKRQERYKETEKVVFT
ncbi:MAG TPA: MauE/DoxX family redox-associated membrane protein [Chitinophagaceae bacterium]|jgi:formate-dependent nitrite reductase membrane component NrfD|nr:MauE/DoxX family redox-associated membrane protein [Chitinophagaceae bacterium]